MIQQKKHAQLCIGSMGRICLPINLVDFYGRILHTLPSRCNNNGGKPGLRQFWKQRGYLHSSTGVSTPGLLLPIIREHCKKRSWRENNHTSHVLLPFTSDCSPSSSRPPSNQKYLLCRYLSTGLCTYKRGPTAFVNKHKIIALFLALALA